MHLFDSHAHLTSDEMLPDIDAIIARSNVERVLNICTDKQTLEEGIALNKKYPHIKNAGATTPHDAHTEGDPFFSLFEEAALSKKLVAVGETGLDYYNSEAPKEIQKKLLIRYLDLSVRAGLPVIFHCREAFDDLFPIVDAEYPSAKPAVLHCFTGTLFEAEEVLKRGWYLSISGIVTFKKSDFLREVAKMVPLSQLLIETDAPYLAPQSKRGKQNEPGYIVETAQKIADVKGITLEEVALATYENGSKLFFKN